MAPTTTITEGQFQASAQKDLLDSTAPVAIPHRFVRMALYAFLFAIPFEAITSDLPIGSLSKPFGYAFFLVAMMQWRVCFTGIPRALICFTAYLLVYGIFGTQYMAAYPEILTRGLMLVQMFVLFWACSNLLQHSFVAAGALWSLGAACGLLAVCQLTGISSVGGESNFGERLAAFGENSNSTGAVFSIGFLSLLALAYLVDKKHVSIRIAVLPVLGTIGLAIVRTGSRGSLLALLIGMLVLLWGRSPLKNRMALRSQLQTMVVVVLAAAFLVWITYTNEMAASRWKATVEDGHISSREKLFAASWDMFLEEPLVGWGPTQNTYELGGRTGYKKADTHNLVLYIMTETGLAGSIPYFMGLAYCVRSTWRGRHGVLQRLPLALLVIVLLVNMSGTWHNTKLHWLILGLGTASACMLSDSSSPSREESI